MIDELPIENPEPMQEVVEPREIEEPPKKTRGRPKGSCKPKKEEAKAAVKPKKSKPLVQSECEEEHRSRPKKVQHEYEDQSSNEEAYRDIDTRAIAAEVISMLSNRHMDRSAQKREKYRSWFQTPQY